jgi:hypothetical protein
LAATGDRSSLAQVDSKARPNGVERVQLALLVASMPSSRSSGPAVADESSVAVGCRRRRLTVPGIAADAVDDGPDAGEHQIAVHVGVPR